VFRGPPDRLASLLPSTSAVGLDVEQQPRASLRGADVRRLTVRRLARGDAHARRVTLRLSRTTPPGKYSGSAEIEGRTVPIVAEVEPLPRLGAEPRRIAVEAEPGGAATVDVQLVNTGNVPCDVSGTTTFCLFDGSGLEQAVWAALASDPPEGRKRIDVLLDELADSHGGLVTTRAARGATIRVGESRQVQLTLRFSDRLKPGKRYAGSWRVDGLRLPVRITTPAAAPKREARGAR
jgi:hypothetical protein